MNKVGKPHHPVEERIDCVLMGLSDKIIGAVQVCKVPDDNFCCDCEQKLVLKWNLFADATQYNNILCLVNNAVMRLYKKCLSEGHTDYSFRVYEISARHYPSNVSAIAVRFYLNIPEDGNFSDGRESDYWDWDFSSRKNYMIYPSKGGM